MITQVTHASLWVKDQAVALKFYRDQLGFKIVSDEANRMPGYRWLTVAPSTQADFQIVLNLATTPEQLARVGRQGIVVLNSTDIHTDYAALRVKGAQAPTA